MEDLVVLIVDDDSLITLIIEDTLLAGGFKSACANSGERAVAIINAAPEKFCALVTDINLGKGQLRGWDVARQVRELTPALPVVYVTGDSGDEWTSMGVPNSILIPKPFAGAQILAAVATLMNNASPQC